VLEAVATTEAGHEEDDERKHKQNGCNDELHFHILPPHLTSQLPSCFVESVRL